MDTRGAIWIPIQFGSFGTMDKPMPMCPGQFTPIVALNIGVTVRSIPVSYAPGAPPAPTYPPFRALRKVNLFLGDFLVNGVDHYGEEMSSVGVAAGTCAVRTAGPSAGRLEATGRPKRSKTALGPALEARTTGRPVSTARTAAQGRCGGRAEPMNQASFVMFTMKRAPPRASARAPAASVISKQISTPKAVSPREKTVASSPASRLASSGGGLPRSEDQRSASGTRR